MKNTDTKGHIFLNVLLKEASGLDKSLSTEGKGQRGKKKEERNIESYNFMTTKHFCGMIKILNSEAVATQHCGCIKGHYIIDFEIIIFM